MSHFDLNQAIEIAGIAATYLRFIQELLELWRRKR